MRRSNQPIKETSLGDSLEELNLEHVEHSWMREALCRGQNADFFFPSDGVGVEHAKTVCAQCPVRMDCLEYALTYRIDHGVWGGCSERERRRILRSRRAADRAAS
jgi:WhiB family redox-sensing transcriptional regulator